MRKILRRKFFDRDVVEVARDLVGAFLLCKIGEHTVVAEIVETEAYDGERDLACHASKGKTARTEVLYGEPGRFYVYLCYGMYYLLNVVAREKGYPAGVLIRGIILQDGTHINGPGKITKFLKIDRTFHNKTASPKTGLWFEKRDTKILAGSISKSARVGVDYAGAVWSKKKYRFFLKKRLILQREG